MTGQDLKNSILQLAIQGKLVPQDANDEPASVLLERIKAEKQKLINEKKIKKEKPLPKITEDEKPFEIPESWEWCRLGDIFNFIDYRGKTPTKINHGIPLITATNIKDGFLDFTTKSFISPEEYETRKSRGITKKGDLVFTTEAPLGHIAINTLSECSCGQRIITFQSYIDELNNKLFCFFILSTYFQELIAAKASGMTATGIKAEIAKTLLIPLPPLSEQHRIVAKIEELMPLVEEYDKAQKELDALNTKLPEALKKSILQEAIQGKLVPQDPNDEPASVLLQRIRKEKEQLVKDGKLKKKDLVTTPISDEEKPFEIPESWEWCRVKDILNVWSARRVHEKDWRTSGIPFYRAREIGKLAQYGIVDNELYIDYSLYNDFSKTGYPKANDLMMTAVGTLGKCYVVKENERFYFKDGSVLCLGNIGGVNPVYIKFLIESPMFVQQYLDESDGTTVATLTMVRMNEYLIPLPPLAEQHRIVAKIEDLFAQIEPLAKALSTPM